MSIPPLKLQITLENMPHSVYRKVLVPEDINMLELHYVIQVAMGWSNSHLFQFQDKQNAPSLTVHAPGESDDIDFFAFGRRAEWMDAEEALLKEDFLEATGGKPFWYWYDFGDDWWHKITFQKPSKKDLASYLGKPLCIDAFGACPPEDVGGPWGYAEWLEIIINKKHPQHAEMRDWAGLSPRQKYDPDAVNLEDINAQLSYFGGSAR